jgi:unsaturated chondroitin disaccharide hydrolase
MMDQAYQKDVMLKLGKKVESMIGQIKDKSPHVAKENGIYNDLPLNWWTSGFWPGILWVMHDFTGKDVFKEAAWDWDIKLEECFKEYPNELHHDVGFQFLPTAVMKHKVTGDVNGLRIGLLAANFLAGRFNPAGNFIRAWNEDKLGWAIIDCMMNIPLLFWASQVTGDPRYKHIATRHADTFLEYAIRPDGSVCHIASFDPESGEFIEQIGGQGYGSTSAWSRGNSWALYGFALTYQYTKDEKYLHAAKRVANHFITNLPEDHVPYWDFRVDSLEGEPRDTSAGAIAASGLLELAELVPEAEKRAYLKAAHQILQSLTENYITWGNPEHEAILIQGTGHKPNNENINVSLIYGDYFYVEAFAKLNGWKKRVF